MSSFYSMHFQSGLIWYQALRNKSFFLFDRIGSSTKLQTINFFLARISRDLNQHIEKAFYYRTVMPIALILGYSATTLIIPRLL